MIHCKSEHKAKLEGVNVQAVAFVATWHLVLNLM